MKKQTKRTIQLFSGVVAGALLARMAYRQNHQLDISSYVYHNDQLPESFHGFRILQVSDLHNARFGFHQKKLIKEVQLATPDIILISGDLIDKRRCHKNNIQPALRFVKEAVRIAPVYYVPGNHEATSEIYPYLKEQLLQMGVEVLGNSMVEFIRNEEAITLIGVKDPKFYLHEPQRFQRNVEHLIQMSDNDFHILLSHRPEYFDFYASCGFDICFCGHAHGGQIRIPKLGGLYAPNQGLFPKYSNGRYVKGNTTMFVSRGLGNSKAPLRIHNHPHLVVVRLCKGPSK